MVHTNPYYDPEWEKLHDRHAAECASLEKERDRLVVPGAMTFDAYKQMSADFDRHHKACLDSFNILYATVQGYVEWLFRNFDVSIGDHGGGIPIPLVDFAQLHTIKEASCMNSNPPPRECK